MIIYSEKHKDLPVVVENEKNSPYKQKPQKTLFKDDSTSPNKATNTKFTPPRKKLKKKKALYLIYNKVEQVRFTEPIKGSGYQTTREQISTLEISKFRAF